MQRMDSEDPRVEMLNTSGLSRCVAASKAAHAFLSAMDVCSVFPLMRCSSSGFASLVVSACVGRERMDVASSRYMSAPLIRSQAAKRYFPKDA